MSQLKILIAIEKSLKNAQSNINNLDDYNIKHLWQNEIGHLLRSVNNTINDMKKIN
jgi:hypothetical protein